MPGVNTRYRPIGGYFQADCVWPDLENLVLVLPGLAVPMFSDVTGVFVRPAKDAYKVVLVLGRRLDYS